MSPGKSGAIYAQGITSGDRQSPFADRQPRAELGDGLREVGLRGQHHVHCFDAQAQAIVIRGTMQPVIEPLDQGRELPPVGFGERVMGSEARSFSTDADECAGFGGALL